MKRERPPVDMANPSVTEVFSVLSRPGLEFMKREKPDELAEASELGTLGHEIIEQYLASRFRAPLEPALMGIDARAPGRRARVESVLDWIDQNVGEVLWSEGRLEDKKFGFHGHPDFAITMKDDPAEKWIIDLKFTAALDPLYALQVTAYGRLLSAKTGEKYKRAILWASGEGVKFRRLPANTEAHHWNLFLYALTLFKSIPQIKI